MAQKENISPLLDVFSYRLRLARTRSKLSMDALCERLGGKVSKQAIAKYEWGKMMPGSEMLCALADALGVEVDYFIRPICFDATGTSLSFRKKVGVAKKDMEALRVEVGDIIERRLEIERLLGVASCSIPDVSGGMPIANSADMERCARRLRLEWSLGSAPISNVQDTLEMHGIGVLRVSGPEGFDGVSAKAGNGRSFVVLNSRTTNTERQRFTALHELGHLLCNAHFDSATTAKEQEKLCHVFAGEMLLPYGAVRDCFCNFTRVPLQGLVALQCRYGISVDAILYRIHCKGDLNDWRYRRFQIKKNTSVEFKRKVEESRFVETRINQFAAMVYSAVTNNLISEEKAAQLMRCSVQEVAENKGFMA